MRKWVAALIASAATVACAVGASAGRDTKATLTVGVGNFSLLGGATRARPFACLDVRSRSKKLTLNVGGLTIGGGLPSLGSRVGRSSVSRFQGYYGAEYRLKRDLTVWGRHFSDHYVVGGAPISGVPFVSAGTFLGASWEF